MKKIIKFSIAVFALVCIYCIPVSAASTTVGDANRDETFDIRDVVRARRYAGGNIEVINKDAVDFNENSQVDSVDVTALHKLLLGISQEQVMTKVFEEDSTITINGVTVDNKREQWILDSEEEGIVGSIVATTTTEQVLYFRGAGKSSDFVAEISAMHYFASGLYGGFQFHDGENTGFLYLDQDGVRWQWGDESTETVGTKYQYGLLADAWSNAETTVKLAVAKRGTMVYVYLNDKLAVQTEWSNISSGEATNKLAIGVMGRIDNENEDVLVLNDSSIVYGTTEARKYIANHSEATLLEENGMFAESLMVGQKTVTSDIDFWNYSQVTSNVIQSQTTNANTYKLFFGRAGDVALMSTYLENMTTVGDVNQAGENLKAGFVLSDGTYYTHIWVFQNRLYVIDAETGNAENILVDAELPATYLLPGDASVPVEFTLALKDGKVFVYCNNKCVNTITLETIMPHTKDDAILAIGISRSEGTTSDLVQFSDIRFSTDENQVNQYLNSYFPEAISINGESPNQYRNKWDLFEEANGVVSTKYRVDKDQGKPLYFSEQGADFAVEMTLKNITEINPEMDNNGYYQNDLMGGLYFNDGTNQGFLVVVQDGIRWSWDKTVTNHQYGLLPAWVLAKDTKLSVKLGVVKQGEDVFVYLNDELKTTLKWTDIVTGGNATADVAVGFYMNANAVAELEISNYSIHFDEDAVKDFVAQTVDYKTGIDEETGAYNTALYGMNGNNVLGADPGVFWLSKEDDPVNGGYFYMYTTGHAKNQQNAKLENSKYADNGIKNLFALCYRSKDLYQWEMCGVNDGYAGVVYADDWCDDKFWAPEVIRYNNKYYMYFSATAKADLGVSNSIINANSTNEYDRLFLAVAESDSPTGPFKICSNTDEATGKKIPTINFQTGKSLTSAWAAIDASPFIDVDDSGNETLYLYFNKHDDSNSTVPNGIWGMKMENATTPYYDTVRCLTIAGYNSVYLSSNLTNASSGGSLLGKKYAPDEAYGQSGEGGINEAPFMVKHDGKYYLIYTKQGYGSVLYATMQAVGTTPLGTFDKLDLSEGNPVHQGYGDGTLQFGDAHGTGHSAIVQKGNELYIVYHKHQNVNNYNTSTLVWTKDKGREIAVDRLSFVNNGTQEVLTANGPLQGLNWLAEDISGYTNLAKTATITVSGLTGEDYLKDGVLPYYQVAQSKRAEVTGDTAEITLTWNEAVELHSVMLYNSLWKENAFSKISRVYFKLEDGTYASIEDLRFPERYYSTTYAMESDKFTECAPTVAEFDSLKVTELTLVINKADKLTDDTNPIYLSELIVLGGKAYADATDSAYGKAHDTDMVIDGMLDEAAWDGKTWLEDDAFTYMYAPDSDGNYGTRTQISSAADRVNIRYTGFVTEKGVYIASMVEDANLITDWQRSQTYNSGWRFYVTAKNVGETRQGDELNTNYYVVDTRGDCIGLNNDCQTAVFIDGRVNSGATKGGIMEMFIPWSALGVDISKGIPTEFGLMPSYNAVVKGTAEGRMTTIVPNYYTTSRSEEYYRFNRDGYNTYEFVPTIRVNGVAVDSYRSLWDLSQEAEGIVSISAVKAEKSLKPLYFAETGQTFMMRATMDYYSDIPDGEATTYQDDVQAGFALHDGTKPVYILLYQNKLRIATCDADGENYQQKNYTNQIDYQVLHKNYNQTPVEMTMIVQDETVYIYADNEPLPVGELKLTEILTSYESGKELAMGIVMNTNNKCDLRYSNIERTTDVDQINAYLNKDTQFPKTVTVNGQDVTSNRRTWDMFSLSKGVISASYVEGGKFASPYENPIYFADTASDFVVEMTATNNTNDVGAGFYFHDGTNESWLAVDEDFIKWGDAENQKAQVLSDKVLMQETQNPITLTVVKNADQVYIYQDGKFVLKKAWADIAPNTGEDTVVAIGMAVFGSGTVSLELKDYSLQTGTEAAGQYLSDHKYFEANAINGTFADLLYVNGQELSSTLDGWTVDGDHVIGTKSAKWNDLYFTKKGSDMLASATVTNITDTSVGVYNKPSNLSGYQADPYAGFVLSDGTNHSFLFVYKSNLRYFNTRDTWTKDTTYGNLVTNLNTVSGPYLQPDENNNQPLQLTVAVKDDQCYVYCAGVQVWTGPITKIMPNYQSGTELSMGLVLHTDGAVNLKFTNISVSNDLKEVVTYIETHK